MNMKINVEELKRVLAGIVDQELLDEALDLAEHLADSQADADKESLEDSIASSDYEMYAYGYDMDEDHRHNPYTRESIYDFDRGVTYNDAGEPIGYM